MQSAAQQQAEADRRPGRGRDRRRRNAALAESGMFLCRPRSARDERLERRGSIRMNLVRAFSSVGILTLVSRVLGFVADM